MLSAIPEKAARLTQHDYAENVCGHRFNISECPKGKADVVWRRVFFEQSEIPYVGRSCLFASIQGHFVELPDLYLDCFQTQSPEMVKRIVKQLVFWDCEKEIETIKKVDRLVLSKMPFSLLYMNQRDPRIMSCITASDADIYEMTLQRYIDLPWYLRKMIVKRLECIEAKEIPKGKCPKDCLGKLRRLKAAELVKKCEHAPHCAKDLLSDAQKKAVSPNKVTPLSDDFEFPDFDEFKS